MKKLCELYAKQIREHADRGWMLKPVRFQEEEFFEMMWSNISWHDQAQHILWMLEEIPTFWAEHKLISNLLTYDEWYESLEKANKAQRWLGFVQGWMIKENYCHVNWLRATVRENEGE